MRISTTTSISFYSSFPHIEVAGFDLSNVPWESMTLDEAGQKLIEMMKSDRDVWLADADLPDGAILVTRYDLDDYCADIYPFKECVD